MNGSEYVQIARDGLWLVVVLSLAPLLASLVVGLAISFFQALTQIQEQTLTFVPKIIVTVIVILLLAEWTLNQLVIFSQRVFDLMLRIGH